MANSRSPRGRRKKREDYAVTASISMPVKMRAWAEQKQHEMGFASFSDFVQHVLRVTGYSDLGQMQL